MSIKTENSPDIIKKSPIIDNILYSSNRNSFISSKNLIFASN